MALSPRPDVPDRTALVVLGMHRSGTSALTRIFGFLGADLPADAIPPKDDNPQGFWEPLSVLEVNRAVLTSAGSNWIDWAPFGEGWWSSPLKAGFVQDAVRALETSFGDSRFFVLKDPRMCRVLPLWLEALAQFGAKPLVVMAQRHPMEVSASIEKRDLLPAGEVWISWLRHALDAEYASRQAPRVVTSYDDLMADWRGVVRRVSNHLGFGWPKQRQSTEAQIDAFLATGHRHHHTVHDPLAGADPRLVPWVRDAYEVLARWSRDAGRPGDTDVLDAVRHAFDAAMPTFEPIVISASSLSVEKRKLTRTVERLKQADPDVVKKLKQERAAQAEALQAAEADRRAVEDEVASLKAELSQFKSALSQRSAEADDLSAALDGVRQDFAQRLSFWRGRLGTYRRQLRDAESAKETAEWFLKEEQAARAVALDALRHQGDVARHDADVAKRDLAIAERKLSEQVTELTVAAAEILDLKAARDAKSDAARRVLDTFMAELAHKGQVPAWTVFGKTRFWKDRAAQRQADLLRKSSWFDAKWYRERYKDVARTGIDPAEHFVLVGYREGRAPGPAFE